METTETIIGIIGIVILVLVYVNIILRISIKSLNKAIKESEKYI